MNACGDSRLRGLRSRKPIGFRQWVVHDMNEPYLKGNKKENRPHYYCFEDENTGIYWMIPLSSKIEKYRKIMEKREAKGKTCDILHILRLDDKRESVFLIQDMFPITEQ